MPEPASILAAPTPEAWLRVAAARWPEILLDHAYCEKKAASSALALIFAYPEDESQNLELSRLAREELRHFEQVTRMMERLGVAHRRLEPARRDRQHGERQEREPREEHGPVHPAGQLHDLRDERDAEVHRDAEHEAGEVRGEHGAMPDIPAPPMPTTKAR